MANSKNILDRWTISAEDLTRLIDNNPSLRGMLHGYVAELKLQQMWFSGDIMYHTKHDDHNRKKKGDHVIKYRGHLLDVECKSLQTNSIRRIGDQWRGKAQVDASDRREVQFPDGTTLNTTLLLKGDFHLLAVNVFAFEDQWRFIFAKNSDLPTSTYARYTPVQQERLIASLVRVCWPPEPPFSEDPYHLLDEIIEEEVQKPDDEIDRLREGVRVEDEPLKEEGN